MLVVFGFVVFGLVVFMRVVFMLVGVRLVSVLPPPELEGNRAGAGRIALCPGERSGLVAVSGADPGTVKALSPVFGGNGPAAFTVGPGVFPNSGHVISSRNV